MIISSLRTDPQVEIAAIRIVAFAGTGQPFVRLTKLMGSQEPALPIGADTNLGAGLDALMAEIGASVTKGGPERKGD